MKHSFFLLPLALLSFAACTAPDSAYYSRGTPESLLDVSSEVVNLSVAGPQELQELSDWVESDQPTRAELYCMDGDIRCNEARQVLDLQGVPTMLVPSPANNVALVYERILARDCNQRFRDNTSNNRNLNHAAWGCSVSANVVQHVSDKQQFVSPNLMDIQPATGAAQAYGRAYAPRAAVAPYSVERPLTSSARSQ